MVGYKVGEARQFDKPPIGRFTINLSVDRTSGEKFEAIAGEFFYVEVVDLPCRVSFNNGDESQSIGLSSGFQLNMPFSGITIFHDNYSEGSNNFQLVIYTSRSPRAFNQYVNPAIQYALPYRASFSITELNIYRVEFPVLPRSRFFSVDSLMIITNAIDPITAAVQYYFLENFPIFGVPASPIVAPKIGSFTKQSGRSSFAVKSSSYSASNFAFSHSVKNIPIPQNAKIAVCEYNFGTFLNINSILFESFAGLSS